jgi:hypothetical protein
MPNGLPEPALSPIHPDKPEPPIELSAIWTATASGKTSVNTPRCQVLDAEMMPLRKSGGWVRYRRLDRIETKTVSVRCFRRDWRPC